MQDPVDPVAVRVRGLRMAFPNVVAIDGVSFEVRPGEVFGLVGPDGAGKTTTIRLMCGIMPPTDGSVEVLGASIPERIGRVVSQIGYMSQRFSLYGDLTVAENIDFFADIHQVPQKERKERADRLLHASRMEPFRKRLAEDLSGGMKQKLALVCTLVHTPKVLFLDEPTTGVDPISRREFWQILYGLVTNGMTLVVSTPYMDEADRCQRLALMSKGRILMCDTPANLRRTMKRVVVDIRVDEPQRARDILARQPSVIAVEAFGRRLHATLNPEADVSRLRAAIEEAALTVHELRAVAPGLEDAFITYLEESDHAA